MKAETEQLFDAQRIHAREFERLYDDGPGPTVPSIARIAHSEYLSPTDADLEKWLPETLTLMRAGLADAADPVTFRPLVVEFWPLGVHYVDALFGATVHARDGNFWADYLSARLGDLRPIDLEDQPLVRWTLRTMGRILDGIPDGWSITTPVLSSPLNIAVNLFGQAALEDLAEQSPAAASGLGVIADAIAALHRLFDNRFAARGVRLYAASHRWAPDGFGHICGCTTQLVGPETYARFVAPLDARILGVYPHGGTIHLCGRHTQHIPCWRDMPEMRGIQLNDAATDDLPAYVAGLREDQVLYVTPTAATPIERILRLCAGRRVIVQARMSR